jgi:pilus assembly protein CpaC
MWLCKNFYKTISIAVCLMAITFTATSYADAVRSLTLMTGAVETITVGSIKRVAVGLEDVAATSVLDNGELLIIARAAGTTDINVWTEGDRIQKIKLTVKMFNNKSTLDALRASMKNLDGVSIREEAGIFIIDGDVNKETKTRADEIIVALSQTGLIGSNILNLLYSKNNVNDPMIRMDVRFVEVNKGVMQKFGIRWQSTMQGPAVGAHIATTVNPAFQVAGSSDTASMAQNISNLDHHFYGYVGMTTLNTSMLDMLAEDNQARTLAAPVLITQSGTQANFLSGGELPIAIINGLGTPSVEFKQYGVQLEILPRIDANNLITSTIKTEVSTIDASVTVQGIPGLLTRRTSSVIAVKDGDTIVISGIVKADDSKVITKIPFIGDLPILGELFKSREFKNAQSELVIFVTPRRTAVDADINTRVLNPAINTIESMKSALNINSALLD